MTMDAYDVRVTHIIEKIAEELDEDRLHSRLDADLRTLIPIMISAGTPEREIITMLVFIIEDARE